MSVSALLTLHFMRAAQCAVLPVLLAALHSTGTSAKLCLMMALSLQCALGGNALTTIVACVNPSVSFRAETKRTLDFAARATKVQNRVGSGVHACCGQCPDNQWALRDSDCSHPAQS